MKREPRTCPACQQPQTRSAWIAVCYLCRRPGCPTCLAKPTATVLMHKGCAYVALDNIGKAPVWPQGIDGCDLRALLTLELHAVQPDTMNPPHPPSGSLNNIDTLRAVQAELAKAERNPELRAAQVVHNTPRYPDDDSMYPSDADNATGAPTKGTTGPISNPEHCADCGAVVMALFGERALAYCPKDTTHD